jgi:hypothetical protein
VNGVAVGLNIGRAEALGAKLVFWDLGGQVGLRTIWEKYYGEAHAVVRIPHPRLSRAWLHCSYHPHKPSTRALAGPFRQGVRSRSRRTAEERA